jgi:hypothetical protein
MAKAVRLDPINRQRPREEVSLFCSRFTSLQPTLRLQTQES